MDKELEYSAIFIELDAILDTRLAILANLDDVLLKKILEKYHNRDEDVFPGMDDSLFKELYANRTKEILSNSIITPMIELIKEFSQKTLKLLVSTPFHYKPKIILNIYPYELIEDEIVILISTIVNETNELADVQVVNMTYEEITPKYVKNNVSIMVLYEYYKWLEIHSANENFKKTTCPDIALLGPRIYFKPKPKRIEEDPHQAMEFLAGPFIGLKLISIEHFSMVLKNDIS